MISIIVAIAENNAIGKDNDLLWHISEDLKYFKRITLGSPIIMGRKTWESLPFKPLPKRENIVISNNKDYKLDNATVFHSLEEAVQYVKKFENCFIIGGGMIYNTILPFCDKLYITKVHKSFEADTFFPEIDSNQWELESQSEIQKDEPSGLEFQFLVYKKK
ncbi:MAG: dihydrofolate reductase [Bacteroidales bacterium]|jgi:dihydrofolate reductase|nr:dihydrofolate reductase [Bacteroidales bacterium]MDD4529153.1 dihydrofolate reductase [Bacteroidales bacterium]MDD4830050.1 dihydrofolate reductase [Bacteroidales bacterium]